MSAEPTSSLTYSELLIETAIKAGFAYYGADGTESPQVPVDAHDLSACKRHVNNALRMFASDAPVAGWRWMNPRATVSLWASIAADATKTVSGGAYDAAENETLITADSAVFLAEMEDHDIAVVSDSDYRIKRYVSPTTVWVTGDASGVAGDTYSITTIGDYVLPRNFSGTHSGPITFARNTNRATTIRWVDEAEIRRVRTFENESTGYPTIAALRLAEDIQSGDRRRYVLEVYPIPSSDFDVLFKYQIGLVGLVELDEYSPAPSVHDETLRAACRAVIERDVDRIVDGPDWQYYRGIRLKRSHEADARSGPRALGYFGDPGAASSDTRLPHNRVWNNVKFE